MDRFMVVSPLFFLLALSHVLFGYRIFVAVKHKRMHPGCKNEDNRGSLVVKSRYIKDGQIASGDLVNCLNGGLRHLQPGRFPGRPVSLPPTMAYDLRRGPLPFPVHPQCAVARTTDHITGAATKGLF